MRTWDVVVQGGYRILVGRSARDNDELTFGVGRPRDLWLHVQGSPGSHVLIQAPEGVDEFPAEVVSRAAELAAWQSKARHTRRKVSVHVARVADVRKVRGAPSGEVRLARYRVVKAYARGPEGPGGDA